MSIVNDYTFGLEFRTRTDEWLAEAAQDRLAREAVEAESGSRATRRRKRTHFMRIWPVPQA